MHSCKLKKPDCRARIFSMIEDTKRFAIHTWYSGLYRIIWYLKGVSVGKHLSVNGAMILTRFKHSTIKIGNNCTFNSHNLFNTRGISPCVIGTYTDYARIEIGNNTGMSGVSINCRELVQIGNRVMIGANVKIGDNDDHDDVLNTKQSAVIIGDNVFIGMHCIILKGVTIGENAIIGAGSVVTKDIPANCVAAGNPCRVISTL